MLYPFRLGRVSTTRDTEFVHCAPAEYMIALDRCQSLGRAPKQIMI